MLSAESFPLTLEFACIIAKDGRGEAFEDRKSKHSHIFYQNVADTQQGCGQMATSWEQIFPMICFIRLYNWFLDLSFGFEDISVDLQLTEMDS